MAEVCKACPVDGRLCSDCESRTQYAIHRLMTLRPEWCVVDARVRFGVPRLNATSLTLDTVVWAVRHGDLAEECGVEKRKANEIAVLVRASDEEWDEAMERGR